MTHRALRLAYRDIPTMACRPGCTDCCGPAPFTKMELERVAEAIPDDAEIVPVGEGFAVIRPAAPLRCAFAADGKCGVYEARPAICRLFGTMPSHPRMSCPHGCKPARPLTQAQGSRIMARVLGAA
jgi:Fe-S-cluster containining protein